MSTPDPAKAVRSAAKASQLGQFANLPTAFKALPRDFANRQKLLGKLDDLKRFGMRQLQEAANLLGQLNRYEMKPDKRLELVQAILGHVYPVMARYYHLYQDKVMSLPESNERRDVIIACIDIAAQAAVAYKHVFKEIYTAKSLGYKRVRERLVEYGGRILELIRLEQRFRALRHQKLPPTIWLDCNRVFFSILAHDDIDAPITLLGNVGTHVKQARSGPVQVEKSTIRKLYLSIQLFGVIDAASWSTRLFHAPDAYLDTIDNALVIHPDDNAELVPGWMLTHIDHKAPPMFQRDKRTPTPAIRIEYAALYNRLIVDYEELAKMKFIARFDANKLSRPLLDLEAIERFPFLETMLFGLRPRERKQKRHAAFGHENLKLYFGYKDAYRLLADLASPDVKQITESRAFRDMLAGFSAGLAEEISATQHTRWEIANFSTGGLLVVTRETRYTNPVHIGQLIAFIPNDDVKRPLLGYISRINRPSEAQIEVAIVRLSSHAEAAIVQDDKDMNGGRGKGVILYQAIDKRWCLVARHEYNFVSGTPLRLLRENNQRLPARLGNVLLTKQEFVVYELSAPGL